MNFSLFLNIFSFLSLFSAIVSLEIPAKADFAELLEKIEMQEAKLQQQSKMSDLLAQVEKRVETVQKFQISRVRPLQQRIEEAEQKLLGFAKLPELMSQLEARMETVVQLQVEHLLPVEERLNEAHNKLRVCSDIEEGVARLERCVSKITQEEKIAERVKKLEGNVTSLHEEAASLAALRKRARAEMQIKIDLLTVQAQKISSLEARLLEIETNQAKQANLPDLIDLYSARQATVNKLHVSDMAAIQEKLKKAEQKLIEYSSLPELVRQLEIRVNSQQANALDRILTLETQLRNLKKASEKEAPQEKVLQQKLAVLEQTQKNSTLLTTELEKSLNDLSERHTSSILTLVANLTSLNEEVVKGKDLPRKVSLLEKDLKSQIDGGKKSASTLAQLSKDVTSLRQIQDNFKIQLNDFKKSFSSSKDQQLQLNKKLESLEQGHKGLQNQTRSQQSQSASTLEKKLTNQLNDVAQRVSALTGRLQQDVSSLQKADKDLEKEVLKCAAALEQGERITALEKSSAAITNETRALNETIKSMMFSDLLQVGNITLLRFLLDLTQNEVNNDVVSLKQADKKLERQLQDSEAQFKSNQNNVLSNANKLKQIEGTISRYDGIINSIKTAQNKDVTGRLTKLESESLAGKKDRAILYDSIKQTTRELRRNEGQAKSQNETLSSLSSRYQNLSMALKDLAALVKFFHSEFSLDNIVDASKRRSALHIAAMEGNVDQMGYLLRNGANAELEDYKKWRPLHLAAWQGHTAIVRELLESGVKVNPVDEFGYTPLHWAAQYGREASVVLLLDTGANLEARDVNDETPLHKAAWYEQTKMVELLLKRGAKINALRKERYTALHLAAQKGYLPCVKALVMKGADVHLRTIDGYTALDLALSHKNQDVINYLNQRT